MVLIKGNFEKRCLKKVIYVLHGRTYILQQILGINITFTQTKIPCLRMKIENYLEDN